MKKLDWPLLGIIDVGCTLGEGVVWDAQRDCVWWLDIQQAKLYCHFPVEDQLRHWDLPERAGSFGLIENDERLVVAFASGFGLYHLDSGNTEWLARPEKHIRGNRFNDGRVDRQGRFWAGTMDEQEEAGAPPASLYRLDIPSGCQAVLQDLTISNGLCWSPDGTTLYHADSPRQQISAYAFDPVSGDCGERRWVATMPDGHYPDGATVDADGYIYSAQWGGRCVARYTPDGKRVGELSLPVSQPSCVAFGGKDLDRLYITSAREDLSEDELAHQPLAGSVLIYQSPYRGLEESLVKLP